MADSMSRFARSWLLIQASREVLRTDNALLILPALSVRRNGCLRRRLRRAGDVGRDVRGDAPARHHGSFSGPIYAWLFCLYVVQYFVVIFFNTALVGAAIACSAAASRRWGRAEARGRAASGRSSVTRSSRRPSACCCRRSPKTRPDRAADRGLGRARLDGGDLPCRADPRRGRCRTVGSGRAQRARCCARPGART